MASELEPSSAEPGPAARSARRHRRRAIVTHVVVALLAGSLVFTLTYDGDNAARAGLFCLA